MKKLKFVIPTWVYIIVASISVFSACRKDRGTVIDNRHQIIYFSGEINGLPQTRAQGMQWSAEDRIGIFMFRNNSILDASSLVDEAFNKMYQTHGNGNFVAHDPNDPLIFPGDQDVQFLAYYPYQRLSNFSPRIDIADQSNPEAIDFMVSNQGASGQPGRGPVLLSFERKMAKLEFKISGTDLQGIRAAWLNMPTTASYNLSEGEFDTPQTAIDLPAKIAYLGANEVIISWTIFPGSSSAPQKITFTKANGQSYTWQVPANTAFTKGHRYQYDLMLGNMGEVTPTPTAAYVELPIIATGHDLVYSLKMGDARRNYSILYNKTHMLAEWVAYPMSANYLGSLSRSNAWDYDPDPAISRLFQADLSRGYPNNQMLDLDRGHQIASGDRTASLLENRQTFYYTNITPQIKSLNQGVWNRLEIQVRTWATAPDVDTLYVVTGAGARSASDNTLDYVDDNSNRKVVKPKFYYKALAMKRGDNYYTVGFRFDNVRVAANANHMNNMLTVAELERETGITFFPALPPEIKQTINRQIWR